MQVHYMNGCSNRFAIFDARGGRFDPGPEKIRAIAATGPAGHPLDQIIVMENGADADVFMRIWNRDGSEVSACGNATRCVGWLLFRDETHAGRDEVRIDTVAGQLLARQTGPASISVDMGVPKFGWQDIPLSEPMDTRGVDLKIGPMDAPYLSRPACVNVGNPHAVFFVPDIDAIDIEAVGPLVEGYPLFPEAVNAGFAQIIAPDRIRLRVWERGAGLTQACGTGACAALVCAARLQKADRHAVLVLDGGELDILWNDEDRIIMTGAVELEHSATL